MYVPGCTISRCNLKPLRLGRVRWALSDCNLLRGMTQKILRDGVYPANASIIKAILEQRKKSGLTPAFLSSLA